MAFDNKPDQRRTFYVQLGVVITSLLIVLFVFYKLGIFDQRSESEQKVTYRIEGSASNITVTYTQADGSQTKPFDERPPWQKTIKFKRPQTVVLTVTNPSQTGTIKCILELNGKIWKTSESKAPEDKVSCAGITP